MSLDGETIAGVARSVYYPHAIAFALDNVDAAPRHARSSDVAPNAVDETRVGYTFVCGDINGREIRGGCLAWTNR